MPSDSSSNKTAPTQFLDAGGIRFAYRRFGSGAGLPLLCLQHFMGTLDNWDPAVTDPLAEGRELILLDNAGIGQSGGVVPETVGAMAQDALAFTDSIGIETFDVLGFSLGGMVAQEIALERPQLIRRMILVGTAPRGGEDIMHLDKPTLAPFFNDPSLKGFSVLQKVFFAPTDTSQAAGAAFVERLQARAGDREPPSGQDIAKAQLAAFRDWETVSGERFADLSRIPHPVLVVEGVHDEMIPVRNSYFLGENLPNAITITYPDAGHGSMFQYAYSFTDLVTSFLDKDSPTLAK